MHADRVVLAGMPAAVLSCLPIGSALAQDPTPAAAPAVAVPINAVLDVGSRSIRLDPLGASVRIPDSIAISHFANHGNAFGFSGDFGGAYNFMGLQISFAARETCTQWSEQKPYKGSKFVTPKKGEEFYDSRWHPKYKLGSGKWMYMCMDRPDGTIMVELSPMKPAAPRAIQEFTSNLADAFVPRPTQTVAAAVVAPVRTSSIDISDDVPNFVVMTGVWCDEGRQVQCDAHRTFLGYHTQCREGSASACSFFGRMSANSGEYEISAKFYSRACELGDPDACKMAKQSQSKVKKKD